MRIRVETVKHQQQRYETCGDWLFDKDGNLVIYVSELGDWRYEAMLAVHELVEAILCKDRNIPEEDVNGFDVGHPELEDPGLDERAPYHKEHMIADSIERALCQHLGLSWNAYEKSMEKLFGTWH